MNLIRVFRIPLALANAVLSLPIAYLGTTAALALCSSMKRPPTPAPHDAQTHFVVLVPAHNEEETVSATIKSLVGQRYPSSLFSVHVVADNCEDRTSELARTNGATVHEREDRDHPGKGPALNWLVDRLASTEVPYDVAVYVDADTTVDQDFLIALDRRFQAGSVAVQGFYGVRDAFDSAPASLRFCALASRHHCRPLARVLVGGSSGLFGNGMAFTRQINLERSWTSHLVEDMEFQLELTLRGIKVDFEPAARVEAEMPDTLEGSVTQHRRWEAGRWEIARRYLPMLLARIRKPGRASRVGALDAALDMCMPPLSLVGATTAVSAGCGIAVSCLSRDRSRWDLVGVFFAATLCLHVLTSLKLVRAPADAYRSLLHAPRFALWKMALLFGALTKRETQWIRTERNIKNAERAGQR